MMGVAFFLQGGGCGDHDKEKKRMKKQVEEDKVEEVEMVDDCDTTL